MPAQYIYSVSAGSNVDLSSRVRAYQTVAKANAEEGSVAISSFIVDDEESGINITGLRQFDWKESSEGSNSRTIFRTFTADRDVARGPFRVARSRQWTVNVADLNSILTRRIMRGSDANRPAETDVARIQWMVGTSELNAVTDTSLISTTGPVAMDAVDYRNQRVIDIIDDCAQQSGKNYFLWLNEIPLTPTVGLFYDYAGSSAYASQVRLTNVNADIDADHIVVSTDPDTAIQTSTLVYQTTFAVINDTLKLNRDPSRVYSSVVVPYNGGDQYVTDASIGNTFQYRDTMAPAVNVKTAAKAQARGIRYLDDADTEEDRLQIAFIVPLARVNQLREGHTFQVKFSHLPGYTDWTWVRALSRQVTALSEEFYRVDLEATPGQAVNSCSTAVTALTASVFHRGLAFTTTPNATTNIPSPASYPAVVIGVGIGQAFGYNVGNTLTVAAPYTTLAGYSPVVYQHTIAVIGYKALTSGAPGTFTMAWTGTSGGGGAINSDVVGIAIPTAATSPVQKADVFQPADSSVTLPANPTVGNLLVMVSVNEGSTDVAVPPGFTQVIGWRIYPPATPGVQGTNVFSINVRCVQTGDDATFFAPKGASAYTWHSLSEWAIT